MFELNRRCKQTNERKRIKRPLWYHLHDYAEKHNDTLDDDFVDFEITGITRRFDAQHHHNHSPVSHGGFLNKPKSSTTIIRPALRHGKSFVQLCFELGSIAYRFRLLRHFRVQNTTFYIHLWQSWKGWSVDRHRSKLSISTFILLSFLSSFSA